MRRNITDFIVNAARMVLALVFIFSGWVKANDPLGMNYKLEPYLSAWGLDLPQMTVVVGAVLLASVEFTLGMCLLMGISRKKTAWFTLWMMAGLTAFTMYVAAFTPVEDCGCFSDVLLIPNWATVLKNVILLACAWLLVWKPYRQVAFLSHSTGWMVSTWTMVFSIAFSFYCYYSLPVTDMQPFRLGADMESLIQVPDSLRPTYTSVAVYRKDGNERTFDIEDEPDSTWTFVRVDRKIEKVGAEPMVKNFTMTGADGYDYTDDLLTDTSYTFLLILPDIEDADDSNIGKINEMYDYSVRHGYAFYGLTSSSPTLVSEWKDMTGAEYPLLQGDMDALRRMVRSNPGLMLLHQGKVIAKWSQTLMPGEEDIHAPLPSLHLDQRSIQREQSRQLWSLAIYLVPVIFVWVVQMVARRLRVNRRKKSQEQPQKEQEESH